MSEKHQAKNPEKPEGNLLLAWLKVLDTDQTMRVNWDEFVKACSVMQRGNARSDSVPQKEADIARVWRAMDRDCSGWISMREFDWETFNLVATFKRWAQREYGRCARAISRIDKNGSGKIAAWELHEALKDEGVSRADAELLFHGLDTLGSGTVGENDVRFLDRWDLVWEDWAASVNNRLG